MKAKQLGALLLAMVSFAGMVLAAKVDVGVGDKGIKVELPEEAEVDINKEIELPEEAELPEEVEIEVKTGKKKPEDKGKPEIAPEEKIGELISTAQRVRAEMFKDLVKQLKAAEYKGSMSDFATGFNEILKELKTDIREKLRDENSAFTRKVVREITERELAKIREEKLAGIDINASQAAQEVDEELDTEDEIDEEALEEELEQMGNEFAAMVTEIAKNGSVEEKKALKDQIKSYLEEVKAKKEKTEKEAEPEDGNEVEDIETEEKESKEVEEKEIEAPEIEEDENELAEDLNTA